MSNMKRVRLGVGLTQSALAIDVGLTQSAIAHYESARRSPGLEDCRRIVAALNHYGAGVTLDEVFPPEAPPTMSQKIPLSRTGKNSTDGAVHLSSTQQAAP